MENLTIGVILQDGAKNIYEVLDKRVSEYQNSHSQTTAMQWQVRRSDGIERWVQQTTIEAMFEENQLWVIPNGKIEPSK